MKLHLFSIPRAFLAGFLLLASTLGFAQASLASTNGILVAGVQAGSPAEKAGIARGDIILEAQGAAVNSPAELQRAIDGKKSGDTLTLKLKHGDAEKTVTVTIGTQNGRPWIGLSLALGQMMYDGNGPWTDIQRYDGPGATVTSVVAGGPAEKAGLKQGDLILSVNGTAVDAQHSLGDLVTAKKVGDTVTLSVQSAGQAARDVKVTLGKSSSDAAKPYLGVEYVMGQQGRWLDSKGYAGRSGALVTQVAADGPAAKAGIKELDLITKVDGTAVTEPQQVVDALSKHKPGDTVTVTVYRTADGKETDVKVTLGKSTDDATKPYLGITMNGMFGPGMMQRGFDGNQGRGWMMQPGPGQGRQGFGGPQPQGQASLPPSTDTQPAPSGTT
jgi:S1-C subfamily serine protease